MTELSKPTYVVGHRNPDTDSICSAIGYAYFQQVRGVNAVAARVGKINSETKFVLETLGFTPPELITDLYPRVKDIMQSEVVTAGPKDTLRDLGRIMRQHKVKSVPVVDEKRFMTGVVTVGDLANLYFDELQMQDLSQAGVDFAGVLKALEGKLLCGDNLERKVAGRVHIAAGSHSLIQKFVSANDIVLVGDRKNAQLTCLDCSISCLVVTGNVKVDEEVIQKAAGLGILVIASAHDTYTCARLINQSIPLEMVMRKEVITFKPTDLVTDIKKIVADTNYRVYPVVENGKLVGAIHRDKLIVQERTKVILVDHNESGQAVEGIEEAQIIEIIDHHRLGGLQTSEPIFIRHEPVGCTATIVANMYWHRNITIPQNIAGLLLAAILSDTVLFKSPTCTEKDQRTARQLAELAQLDVFEFGMSILKAGASIKGMSTADIIANDIKEFQIGDYRMTIGQISVMDADEVLSIKEELQQSMEALRQKENYDMVLLMVTDILNEGTHLVYIGQPVSLLKQAFGSEGKDRVLYLPGVMSRKKQIIPPMSEAARI
ncbi:MULTISPECIES: putative manganese-dependent inorganic diphosphatase [Pelosinus]|uniref:inorganic diphosphatase n=2 Tax=Pelosinus TaxID=365348 RepID=I8TXG2_9FIRM|nr:MULTISPECIES: putative manganese-dependent inorganic diphosphatase [Pelosinus]AJQ28238.1 putative signal transduction protein with CBS domain containing protein [Pelosinus fermentans JBW45]MCC5465152.1 putative manganese-dependent inorganic diphosphatase [Pelosinus baikalensis]MCC5465233.1 putative manganese-dependent inorganic diphosphatase [Pelosinus baikalensis]